MVQKVVPTASQGDREMQLDVVTNFLQRRSSMSNRFRMKYDNSLIPNLLT